MNYIRFVGGLVSHVGEASAASRRVGTLLVTFVLNRHANTLRAQIARHVTRHITAIKLLIQVELETITVNIGAVYLVNTANQQNEKIATNYTQQVKNLAICC